MKPKCRDAPPDREISANDPASTSNPVDVSFLHKVRSMVANIYINIDRFYINATRYIKSYGVRGDVSKKMC